MFDLGPKHHQFIIIKLIMLNLTQQNVIDFLSWHYNHYLTNRSVYNLIPTWSTGGNVVSRDFARPVQPDFVRAVSSQTFKNFDGS